ncbi:MAG: exopolyphosphatase, partial [Flavobacteriaceae bacterium]
LTLISPRQRKRNLLLYSTLDRSDVIIPATQIYLKALKWSGATEIYVPKIGLSDGMIKVLYKQNN